MFWTIVWLAVLIYPVVGLISVPVLTRDAYRRSRLAHPEYEDERHKVESSGQAWADALFWPVYLTMHFSMTLLEKDAQKAIQDQQTRRYLEEATEAPKKEWLSKFTQAELDSQKRNNLTDEGG